MLLYSPSYTISTLPKNDFSIVTSYKQLFNLSKEVAFTLKKGGNAFLIKGGEAFCWGMHFPSQDSWCVETEFFVPDCILFRTYL